MSRTVLLLCPRNAAYFERSADEQSLVFRGTSAATEPDERAASAVVEMLKADGIDASTHEPRQVSRDQLADAFQGMSLGCGVSERAPSEEAIALTFHHPARS